MNYSDFSTEDFIADEKFVRWVNSPNETLDLFWKNWIKENPSKEEIINEAKSFIQSLAFDQSELASAEVEDMLQNIHKNITPSETSNHSKRKIHPMPWIGAAAAIALLILATFWMMSPSKTIIQTAFNETQSMQLPDGTEVILNANSEIQMAKNWEDEKIREVWLSGEAFFHVTNSPTVGARKFIVHTDDIDVEVLGTEFNVNARQEKTTIVLQSGKIQLSQKEKTAIPINVNPGERVILKEEKLDKLDVNPKIYTSWTEQKLFFEKTPLSHLLEILENNYGYQIELKNDELLNKELSGTAPISSNPKILIKGLSTMFNLKIEHKSGKKIIISNQ